MPWLAPVTTTRRSSSRNEASGSSSVMAGVSQGLPGGLEQDLAQLLRRIDHHVVAARDRAGAPGPIGRARSERAVEARIGVAPGAHVGLARDAVNRAGEPD